MVDGCSGATLLEQVVVDQVLPVIVDSAIGHRRGEETKTMVVILASSVCCSCWFRHRRHVRHGTVL